MKEEDHSRYKRQLLLDQIGVEGQQKLRDASVLIIGTGGLGAVVAAYLTGAGVGKIGLVDFDNVEMSNLHRQVHYTEQDIGKPKAKALASNLGKLNSEIEFDVHQTAFSRLNGASIGRPYQIWVDCTDQIEVRYAINDVAVSLHKPWVYGAVHGFEGQVTVFNYQGGPTYRCLFPEKKAASVPNCVELGVVGPLPGIIALYQAMEIIKIIAGFGRALSGRLIWVDVLEMHHNELTFSRNANAIGIAKDNMKIKHDNEQINKLLKHNDVADLLHNKPNIQVVDLRGENEAEQLFDRSVNIPHYAFQERFNELDKTKPVLLICQAGVKSKWAKDILARNGYDEVYSLIGGVNVIEMNK